MSVVYSNLYMSDTVLLSTVFMFQVSQVAVYNFTRIKLCLNLNFLCSAGNNVTFHSMAMQQTGTVLGISKFTTQCVNREYIFGQRLSCPQQ